MNVIPFINILDLKKIPVASAALIQNTIFKQSSDMSGMIWKMKKATDEFDKKSKTLE